MSLQLHYITSCEAASLVTSGFHRREQEPGPDRLLKTGHSVEATIRRFAVP
ncbi:hypothetical protein DPMN_124320 [Dreissena polymorpha]|uniref:Uncharacterized protein n=1 Tax=Dreissena polymorpha TaxID=45954 RepID=A0A9D4GW54_DREPO|nr:hypothetical protein DPMN_124320 [Dreissena polymorpha]